MNMYILMCSFDDSKARIIGDEKLHFGCLQLHIYEEYKYERIMQV